MADYEYELLDLPARPTRRARSRRYSPPVVTSPSVLPFGEIRDWEDFEWLCVEIVEKAEGLTVHKFGRRGQKQHGIDIYALHESGRYWVYQVRRVRSFSGTDLTEVIEGLDREELPFDVEKSVVCVACDFNHTADLRRLEELRREWAPLRIDIYDSRKLSRKLRSHPDIVDAFFGEAWARVFCHNPTVVKGKRALPAMRRVSALGLHQAAVVVAAEGDERQILLNDLYASREIEDELLTALGEGSGRFILVVGDGGAGKTSLLWRLHASSRRDPRSEAWFVKATDLLSTSSADFVTLPTLPMQTIEDAVHEAISQGLRPLLLLDTADAMLHSDSGRDSLLLLVEALREEDCYVIATSRPLEAASISSAADNRFVLGNFTETELPDAVQRYGSAFYSGQLDSERADLLATVQNAVSQGLPLLDVCLNPLTLRMLFQLYAPDELIPSEVNVVSLYKLYWERRVESDQRTVMSGSQEAGRNLGRETARLAGAFVAEGTLELARETVSSVLRLTGMSTQQLDDLAGRGVITRSNGTRYTFFHQTFLEHAAGRFFAQFGVRGLRTIFQRIVDHRDQVLAPILEHALLCAEDELGPVRRAADEILKKAIISNDVMLHAVGVYVYVHRRAVSPDLLHAMNTMLAESGEFVAMLFLRAAHNTLPSRTEEVFTHLSTIWTQREWKEKHHIFGLLARIARRDPNAAKTFIDQHACIDYVLTIHSTTPEIPSIALQPLVKAICEVAETDRVWTWGAIGRFWELSLRFRGRELQVLLLDAVTNQLRNGVDMGDEPAKRMYSLFEASAAPSHRDHYALSQAYGRLLAWDWALRDLDIEAILGEIAGLDQIARLASLTALLSSIFNNPSSGDVEKCLQFFASEAEPRLRWDYVRIVMPALLTGVPNEHADPTSPSTERTRSEHGHKTAYSPRQARRFARRILCSSTGAAAQPFDAIQSAVRSSVIYSGLVANEFLEIVPLSSHRSQDAWLDSHRLLPLLGQGVLSAHPGASAAWATLRESQEEQRAVELSKAMTSLTRFIKTHSLAAELVAEMVLRSQRLSGFTNAVQEIALNHPETLQRHREHLRRLLENELKAASGRTRRAATKLWLELSRTKIVLPPSFKALRWRLEREEDIGTRLHLIDMCLEVVAHDRADRDDVIAFLEDHIQGSASKAESRRRSLASVDPRLRDRILLVLTTLLADAPGHLERSLELAFSSTARTERVLALRPSLLQLSHTHPDEALSKVEEIASRCRDRFSGKARRDIAAAFRVVVRTSFARCTEAAAGHALLELRNDVPFGRIIIEALTGSTFHGLRAQLDELMTQSNVPPQLREVIRRYRVGRKSGASEDWPELYEMLRADAKTQ